GGVKLEHLNPHPIPGAGFSGQKYNKNNGSKGQWWARRDSNPQPSGYEPPALTIELQARRTLIRCFRIYRQEAGKTWAPQSVHNHNLKRVWFNFFGANPMSRSLVALAMMVPLIAGVPALAQEVDMRSKINV